jgi:type I restriction enzyme S subunit
MAVLGGDGPRPLPRVVRPLPLPRPRKAPARRLPLGDIPQGWEVKAVESFCPLVSRGVTPKYEAGSGRFIINQKVNRGSELTLDDLKELEPTLEVPADKFARFGDVLVNCLGEGTIGRVHFYTEPHQDWAVDQHMSICRAAKPSDSLYVYFSLESPEGQSRITSLKTGGTNMTMFNISALRSFAVAAPPDKLLARFAELTLSMLRQKQALTELNRNLRRTRDLLLPRLLSGQVELASVSANGVPSNQPGATPQVSTRKHHKG